MILIDANLLLYAYDVESPRHEPARRWLERMLGDEPDVRFALATLLAFVRIGTEPRVFVRPLSAKVAIDTVSSWLERPNVAVAHPTERHWLVLADVAASSGIRGARMSDAHLAALTMEHGATLMTTDRDFARFPKLRFRDPLTT